MDRAASSAGTSPSASPVLVRVRVGRTDGQKRRSWHAARLADDIQRSLSADRGGGGGHGGGDDDDPPQVVVSRSSWHPNDDVGGDRAAASPSPATPYRCASGWAITDREHSNGSRGPARFTIASWADVRRPPASPVMDAITAEPFYHSNGNYEQEQVQQEQQEQPVVALSFTLSEVPDVPASYIPSPASPTSDDDMYHKRLVSAISDHYFEGVVKELRGVPRPFFPPD